MAETAFWSAILFICYTYAGYPVLLKMACLIRDRPVKKGPIEPAVSFIITAYNEEKRIAAKIDNTLQQTYPRAKLEIIVASDCSSDRTDEIVRGYQGQGVRLVRAPERKGKEHAQKLAVEAAIGDILVFSDVATILDHDGIANAVTNFDDATVGCVSSVDKFVDEHGNISGEGAYVKYEMLLRNLETRLNSVVGLSGSFFAARKEVCGDWAVDLQSDFNTLFNAMKRGMRGVSDPDSIGYYKNIADERKEFDRKVRTVTRGIAVFMRSLSLLNPFRYGVFSWQLLSHKLCRWLVPFAMIAAFVSNAVLASRSPFYFYAFVAQLLFYGVAVVGLSTQLSQQRAVKLLSFFVLVNVSILKAWYGYLRGDRLLVWEPSKR